MARCKCAFSNFEITHPSCTTNLMQKKSTIQLLSVWKSNKYSVTMVSLEIERSECLERKKIPNDMNLDAADTDFCQYAQDLISQVQISQWEEAPGAYLFLFQFLNHF